MDITTLFNSQDIDIVLKLFVALLLGMSLGVERAIAGKTAGMRTYGLVTMGSALFVIVGIFSSSGYGSTTTVFTDSSARITAAIIQGIGFIGAGLIFFKGEKVSGVTTAAGIWVSAGVGIAIGYGFFMLAVITTIFALFVFTSLWYIENKIKSFAHFSPED
ncbi:MAG: MgtC/SapB family protein [Patescibacteria group bacterium]